MKMSIFWPTTGPKQAGRRPRRRSKNIVTTLEARFCEKLTMFGRITKASVKMVKKHPFEISI
jgi:hypothetical protein